jgi:hypothetical protein
MKNFTEKPLQSVTAEDIDNIYIHMTYGGLRRATAVKPTEMYPATEELPTLYYTEERNPETKEIEYSIHAITADILRFLLKKEVSSSTEEGEGTEGEGTEGGETTTPAEGSESTKG